MCGRWKMRSCEEEWGRGGGSDRGRSDHDGRVVQVEVVQVEGVSGGPLVGCGGWGVGVCREGWREQGREGRRERVTNALGEGRGDSLSVFLIFRMG